jgi:transcriptional regulator with XRE-family HTH domain
MTTKQTRRLRNYDRGMLRSAFVSLFVSVMAEHRRRGGLTQQDLAKKIGRDKSAVSRWLSGSPNWTLDTIADLAGALDLELRVDARERGTGVVFTPIGIEQRPVVTFAPTRAIVPLAQIPRPRVSLVAA